ncbi:PAS domain S-box-containing protein [Roseomonas rosea]|uniref:histidine kinase n=1 Tax=Muricoccus roseus TaxID=198092 RepID=A0A1M6JYX6_9PROT|nr:PAS domain S-box protein [Roseomonas rosea]SHJ51903.1 PAS domain S-box-containing protein [Roseomonas rosea]
MRGERQDPSSSPPSGPTAPGLGFLHGAGEAGALIQALDGTNSPLGLAEGWSATLRCVMGIVLPSRAQIAVFWGLDYVALYNEAYAPSIGTKHPRAMGRPARESWGELWDVLGPLLDGVRETGETLHAHDARFLIDRHGYLEEVFFDISYSAVHEDGAVAGIVCVVAETTGRVLADRRLRGLRATGLSLANAGRVEEACAAALSAMAAENPADLPWGRILLDGEAGLSTVASHGAAPEGDLADVQAAVLRAGVARVVPGGLALPLMAGAEVAGVFLAGLNPNLRVEGEYGSYLGLVAGQISLAITRLRQQEEERRAAARLRESEARFRNMADHAPVLVWMTEPDGRCVYLSQRWYAFTGQTPETGLGDGWLDAVHPEDRAHAKAVFARATATASEFQIEYRLRRADGAYVWMIDAAAPRLGEEGRFAGFIGSVLDIGDRRRAEEARDLLARELSHRIKNIFMVTGGLAALSARGDAAAEAFAARLQARLRALSLAHDLVRPEVPEAGGGPLSLRGLTLHGLLQALLEPYADGERVGVEGADCPVGYAAANALALVLHEQATNAVKYGALSAPAGRVRITTRLEDGVLRLEWRETGGPRLGGPPTRRGFGTMLAARSLAGQVQGRMVHDWRPEGLVMQLEVPRAGLER